MADSDIIEAIAQRWFYIPADAAGRPSPWVWEKQPEHIQEQYRGYARDFWNNPDRARRHMQHTARLVQSLATWVGENG